MNAQSPLVAPIISVIPATIDSGQSSTLVTTNSFSGGTSPYICQWFQKAPGANFYSSLGSRFGSYSGCDTSGAPTNSTGPLTIVGTWSFLLQVTDSSGTPLTVNSAPVTVTVNPVLTAPTISASPGALDTGQGSTLTTTVSFSGGTPTYTCQWLEKAPGGGGYGSLGSSLSCDTSSLPTVSTGALLTTGTWSFELQVTDSSGVPATITSNAVTVTVNSALAAPIVSVSPIAINSGQSSTLSTTTSFSGGTLPYTCQWLKKSPTDTSYVALGSSFTTGCTPTSKPSVSTGALTTLGIWSFELQVADSSSTPMTVNSAPVTVTVNPVLTAPTISASPGTIEGGQSSILTTTNSFSGGTPTYTCQWLEEAPGAGGYSSFGSFSCDTTSLPTVSTGILSTPGVWNFELQVTDSASVSVASVPVAVTVNSAPSPPTISASPGALDTGQGSTLTTTVSFSGGTPTYTCQWLEKAPGGGGYGSLGSSFGCAAGSKPSVSTGALLTTGTWSFEFQVTDSVSVAAVSAPVTVKVSPALGVPTVTPSAGAIDIGQSVTVAVSWGGGTSPFTIKLYSSSTSSCSSTSTLLKTRNGQVSSPHNFNGLPVLTANTYYCATVADGSGIPETAISSVQEVTVNPALAPPTISASPTLIGKGQSAAVSVSTSFIGGTSPYACQWQKKSPTATSFTALGSPFTPGCTPTSKPSVSTGALTTLGTWSFRLQVKDATGKTVVSLPARLTVKAPTLTTISCTKSTIAVGARTVCTAIVTGSYSSHTGIITWSKVSRTGGVTFSSKTCTLVAGRCSVTIKATVRGSVTIKATYSGDPQNPWSYGTIVRTIT